jgi:hypothetical protein
MAEIGIKRLGAGHRQEDGTEHDETVEALMKRKQTA